MSDISNSAAAAEQLRAQALELDLEIRARAAELGRVRRELRALDVLPPSGLVRVYVYNEAEVSGLTEQAIRTEGSATRFAHRVGVNPAFLCDVRASRRSPSPKLLKALGLRRVIGYIREDQP